MFRSLILSCHKQPKNSQFRLLRLQCQKSAQQQQQQQRRRFCQQTKENKAAAPTEGATGGAQGLPPPTTITFEQKTKAAANGVLWIGILGLIGVSGYYIGRELMPTKLSPNQVFNSAFEVLRDHPEIHAILGDNIKGYGADRSRHREGRRNFVEHDIYADIDGINRCRVKFNMEGSRGKAVIYAETADNLPKGEFSYIIIEENKHGRSVAVALVDNRKQVTRGELQEKIVDRLNKGKVELYGVSNCPYTSRQLIELGEFSEKLNVIMCDKEENSAKCKEAEGLGMQGYPTWKFGSEVMPGFKPLEQLEQICISGAF